jgi:hypothetical protein
LPQFIIIDGAEGLGKTSLGQLIANALAPSPLIFQNKSTTNVKLFNMSIDGGKDAAKEVVSFINSPLIAAPRIVLMDEAHGLTAAAQDAFLVDTEYLPKDAYIILMTTNVSNLRDTLKSRAFQVHLSPLSQSDIMLILKRFCTQQGLRIQGGDSTLQIIAGWSAGKPRAALNLLSGFGKNTAVSANTIKEFIGYTDITVSLPIARFLGDSLIQGIAYLQEIRPSQCILEHFVELLRIKQGLGSIKFSLDDTIAAKSAVENTSQDSLIKFTYEIAALPTLTTSGLIAAFIHSHPMFDTLFTTTKSNEELMREELPFIQKSENTLTADSPAPTLWSVLKNSAVVED